MTVEWEMAARLVMSCVLGGFIGYEREAQHKSAGLRTHVLVSVGSCLIMILSIKIYSSVQGFTNADPTRLAAQVVSGIGFLGAGSIIKDGPNVKGLTTAASLWVVSGVGLAVGSGYYMGAFMTTGLVFLTLAILARIENKGERRMPMLLITTVDLPGQIGHIGSALGNYGIHIKDLKMDEKKDGLELSFRIHTPEFLDYNELITGILSIKGISSVRIE